MSEIGSDFSSHNMTSRQISLDSLVLDLDDGTQHNDSFVTELTAYHLMGRYQKQSVLNILYEMEMTDSISQLEESKIKMGEYLRQLQNELIEKRGLFFVIKNEGCVDVHGELASDINTQHRDLYIKELVSYYEVIKDLKEVSEALNSNSNTFDNSGVSTFNDIQDAAVNFLGDSFPVDVVRIPHSSSLYGDLSAVSLLMHNFSARVPDFIYNCGAIEVN